MAVGGGRAGWRCSQLCGSRGSMFGSSDGGIKVEARLLGSDLLRWFGASISSSLRLSFRCYGFVAWWL